MMKILQQIVNSFKGSNNELFSMLPFSFLKNRAFNKSFKSVAVLGVCLLFGLQLVSLKAAEKENSTLSTSVLLETSSSANETINVLASIVEIKTKNSNPAVSLYGSKERSRNTIRSVFFADDGIWDGGGADNLWSNPVNWSNDVLPSKTTDVKFGDYAGEGNTSKVVIIDIDVSIASLTIDVSYTANIDAATNDPDITINGVTTADGTGTLLLGDGDLDFSRGY